MASRTTSFKRFPSKIQGDKHADFHVYLRLNSHDQKTLFCPVTKQQLRGIWNSSN